MKKTYFIFLFAGILFNDALTQTKIERIDKLVSTYADYGKFNGSILVSEKGQVVYKKGFGLANVEWGIPNQPDTKHRLASITKQFTSMLVMQLVAEDKLELDVPITTYLPDYPKETGSIITLHHLLSHTSGLPNYTSFSDYGGRMADAYKPEEIVRIFADSTLDFTPGERFQYSNSGYVLLGYLMERVTGQSYGELLQTRIFEPLQMVNSVFAPNSSVFKNKASGYDRVGNTFQNAFYIDMSLPYSAGGIYSTVEDLYLWDQALYGEKLIPKKYLNLLFENHVSSWGQQSYGYGWQMGNMSLGNTADQIQTISHSGGINGFNTLITRIPSDKSLIVLLNNTGVAPLNELTMAIAGILYDKPYDLPKKSLANSLFDVIEKKGTQAALLYYQNNKDSRDYYLDEYEMNTLGYHFLQSGKTNEAAFLFKINIDAYPNAFNTYDSYGEALLVLGDTIQSIENYLKSVKLNPGNTYGMAVLKRLNVNTDSIIKKVTLEELIILEGDYSIIDPPPGADKNWMIKFSIANGELNGNDRGYHYRLIPVGENQFINPDDGGTLVFDTKDKSAITLMLLGRFKFRKEIK